MSFSIDHPYQPIFIIGAPRSGTNMLRDVLTSFSEIATWPCDEINPIWRHYNTDCPTDEFPPEFATDRVKAFIRSRFAALYSKTTAPMLLEKTCANSLRVGFVYEIFPEAKFVFILRDGRDAAASAMDRWRASSDWRYLLKKARFVPASDIPLYGFRHIRNRIHQRGAESRQLKTWGPRFREMDQAVRELSLAEVCAIQWRECVEKAQEDLSHIPQAQVHRLVYEELVEQPKEVLQGLLMFLRLGKSKEEVQEAVKPIRPNSVGRWRQKLSSEEVSKITPHLESTLEKYGYATRQASASP